MLRGPNPHLAVQWVTKMKMGGIMMDCEETFSMEIRVGVKAVAVGMRVATALRMFEGARRRGWNEKRSQRTVLFSLVAVRFKKVSVEEEEEVPLSESS